MAELPKPLGLLAELTHRCPLGCPYCSNPLALESRDDAYAVVGAALELASRQIRTGTPENIMDLAPTIERLFRGVLAVSPHGEPAAT